MLRDMHREKIHSHMEAKNFVGEKFASRIHKIIGEWRTNAQCCDYLLQLVLNFLFYLTS